MKLSLASVAIFTFFCKPAYFANVWPSVTECGKLNINSFYKPANATDLDEFPWTALVGYEDEGELKNLCTAVLISKRYLISIAHCYDHYEADHVILGDWNPINKIDEKDCNSHGKCAPLPKKYDISEIILHPDYNSRARDFDLALLRLNDLVTFNAFISPICMPMPMSDNEDYSGQYLPYTGFALHLFDRAAYKVKALVHIMDSKRCNEAVKNIQFRAKGNQICGILYAKNVFLSGAPLMGVYKEDDEPKRFFLIGVVAAGAFIPGTLIPEIFIRISSFRDWINFNVVE